MTGPRRASPAPAGRPTTRQRRLLDGQSAVVDVTAQQRDALGEPRHRVHARLLGSFPTLRAFREAADAAGFWVGPRDDVHFVGTRRLPDGREQQEVTRALPGVLLLCPLDGSWPVLRVDTLQPVDAAPPA